MGMTVLKAFQQGWSIIPIKLDKRPYVRWEPYQSTRPDLEMLKAWHAQYSPPAWAVVTGAISGIVILDFDGADGIDTLETLGLQAHVRTGSGGAHLYLEHPGFPVSTLNGKSKRELGQRYPGLDIRADGGYAVFYGKNTAGPYVWLREPIPDPLTALPAELRQFLGLEKVDTGLPLASGDRIDILLQKALEQSAGGRNAAGFWLACQLRDHQVLYADAETLMRQYQASVSTLNTKGIHEPYTVQEALASLRQAYDAPAREPALPAAHHEKEPALANAVDDEGGNLPTVTVRTWPIPPAPAAFYGLAGDFVRIVEPHTEADPVALLTSFLIAFGNIIGRNSYFLAEADRHYTNLFSVIVGLSSKGRKGTSFGHIRHLFQQLDEAWATDRIRSGLSSGEGLIWSVRDPIEKEEPIRERGHVTGYQSVQTDAGESDKRLLCQEGEFAGVLRVLEREGNTLSAIIRSAWDTGTLTTLTKNSPARATNAHISVIGHITKDELLRYMTSTEAGNGFGNRFLWVCVQRARILPEGGNLTGDELAPLFDRLGHAVMFAKTASELKRDEEARALWYAVYPELSEGKPGLLGSLIGRAEAQVMRLACIYALLDCSPRIRKAHLEAALAVWRYCEDSARYIFGDSLGNPLADDLYRLLKESPNGMTRNEICNHYGRHRTAQEIAKALGMLAEHGLAYCIKDTTTGGRAAERWFAVTTPSTGEKSEKSEISQPAGGDSSLHSLFSQASVEGNNAEPFQDGDRIRNRENTFQATITKVYPPEDLFPLGWAEVVTDDGETGQVDLAGVKKDTGGG